MNTVFRGLAGGETHNPITLPEEDNSNEQVWSPLELKGGVLIGCDSKTSATNLIRILSASMYYITEDTPDVTTW